jgi:hypothetical protein
MSAARRAKSSSAPTSATLAWLFYGLAFNFTSCGDPVPDATVASLGHEDPGVPPGPLHRPGQPCLACHRDGGKASNFSIAGTVYKDILSRNPVGNVSVTIIDSVNGTFTATTNCAGNFYVKTDEFAPIYPVWMSMRAGTVQRDMASPSFREGSCAGCHTDPRGPASPGHVYLIEDPTVDMAPPSQCN